MTRYLAAAVLMIGALLASTVSAQQFEDPIALVQHVYEPYLAGQVPDDHHDFFSPTLETLFQAAMAATPEGEIGPLDFDPIVNGQDFELSDLKVQTIQNDGSSAIVEASFVNLGEPQRILFMLSHRDDGWKVNDLESIGSFNWRLSDLLTGDSAFN